MKANWWKVLVVVVLAAAVVMVVASKKKGTNEGSSVAAESTATSSSTTRDRTDESGKGQDQRPPNDQLATDTSESGKDASRARLGAEETADQVKSRDVSPKPPPKKTEAASPEENVVRTKTDTPKAKPQTINESPKVLPKLVDLGAKKCVPCKMMAPILEELSKDYKGKLVVKFIDVWENRSAAQEYGIRSIPTQIFYDENGEEFFRHVGFFSKQKIMAAFKKQGINLEKE